VKTGVVAEVRRLKSEPGNQLVVMGSGSIVAQLTDAGLVDEYQLVVQPVVLGNGKRIFDGVQKRPALALLSTRVFANGNLLLCYRSNH